MEPETADKKIRRTKQSKATYLPPDLIMEILLRLPVKSVVKFCCVSKLWSSIPNLPSFTSSFLPPSSPRLLILSKKHDKVFVFSIPQNQINSDNKPQLADSYVVTSRKPFLFVNPQSVHGLICIRRTGKRQIWNPTRRNLSTLPTPERYWRDTTILLGYDSIDGIYKVLSITPNVRSQPRVLTLNGAQKSWRVVTQEITEHCPLHRCGKCINGFIYYGAYLESNLDDYILVSFHVRSEKMSMIKVPWNPGSNTLLVSYHGKLACVISKNDDDITLWILEDAEKHVWSDKHLQLPFSLFDPVLRTSLRLRGVNDGGELIYVPVELVNPFYIIYFDPDRNSYRKVVFEGVGDEQFRRRNGLGGNVTLHTFAVFPNHIETLGQASSLSYVPDGVAESARPRKPNQKYF